MTLLIKLATIAGITGAAAVIAVPALRGPVNRAKNNINEALDAEYVVDNYKAEYVELYKKRAAVAETRSKLSIEQKVNARHIELAEKKVESAKANVVNGGTSDLRAFGQAKNAYEAAKTELANYKTLADVYAKSVEKLDKTLAVIDANMAKAKLNVDTMASKKVMLDTVKSVNKTLADLNGVGDATLAVNVEKLDDDMIRESVKLDALSGDAAAPCMTREEADEYIAELVDAPAAK